MTDAIGQATVLAYADAADPLRLTKVPDAIGRTAQFTYNAAGQLATITDAVGIVSRLTYDDEDFIAGLTTPYGTTSFRHEASPLGVYNVRYIEATDPEGGTERLEFRWQEDTLPVSEPASASRTSPSSR